MVLVYFGYIARVARVGTVEALDADYTRTAILKGLSMPAVLRRHVLRNALLPTITVAASLVGYLVGGLVIIENLFHYQRHRRTDLFCCQNQVIFRCWRPAC